VSERNPLDLDHEIDDAINLFEERRAAKWADAEEGKRVNILADSIADLLFESATTLQSPSDDYRTWRNVEDVLTDRLELRDEVVEALQVKIAQELFGHPLEMAERALELMRVSLTIDAREEVGRFLALVARSHILGLTVECGVMCRAALDMAVGGRFRSAGIDPPIKHVPLASFPDRLLAAEERGWLNDAAVNAAKAVWTLGSKVVHGSNQLEIDRLDTIKKTATVLEQLYAAKG
jgi:hypothetical protein